MSAALGVVVVMLATFVAGGSVCRVNALHPRQHKAGWRLMYVVYGGYGMGCGLYTVAMRPDDDLLALLLAGLLATALNLALTWRQWQAGLVPAITQITPDFTKDAT
jgi:hypothetical protein